MELIDKGSLLTYSDQIKNPVSKKVVFATATFLKHFFGWLPNNPADNTYYQESSENVTAMRENGEDLGTPESSQSALNSADTSLKGAWFWEWDNTDEPKRRIWYKPISGTTPYDNFVLADIGFRWGNFGGEDSTGLPFDPIITTMPTVTMRTGQRFDAELGQTGSGSLGMAKALEIMSRTDFEPNGRITFTERIDTFGGV
jgi:hypothetical protein